MRRLSDRGVYCMVSVVWRVVVRLIVVAVVTVHLPAQAAAFELFGFRLFGDDEAKEAVVDPVEYSAAITVAGEVGDASELSDALGEGSLLVRRQDEPPSGTIGLISRARDDQANLLALLYEHARYAATVSIIIAGRPLEQIDVADELNAFSGKVPVTVTVDPGPVFRFGRIRMTGPDAPRAAAAAVEAGLAEGKRAKSTRIVAAEAAIAEAWKQAGYPFAEVSDRDVIADHKTQRLDVTLHVRTGAEARLGEARIKGTERLSPEFLRRQAAVPAGEAYHPATIERIRKNLAGLDAVGSVSVEVAHTPGPDGLHPVLIEVSERKRRTVGAGAEYSSTEGLNVQTFWLHRNLFGKAESVRFDARIGR